MRLCELITNVNEKTYSVNWSKDFTMDVIVNHHFVTITLYILKGRIFITLKILYKNIKEREIKEKESILTTCMYMY